MNESKNKLIDNIDKTANITTGKPEVITKKKSAKREIKDLRRKSTAKEAIETLDRDVEIFGFTKGQFSSIDLIHAVIDKIGGHAEKLTISTWAAAKADVSQVLDMLSSGIIDDSRWLLDLTFQRRMPELAASIRNTFGDDSIRVAKNHAKFTLIKSKNWKIVIRTSMNINYNPRFEDFTLSHDPELYDFISSVVDSVWEKQTKDLAFERPKDIELNFFKDL